MMKLNARTRYALLAALDLADHYAPETPVKVKEIAARTGAPPQYLVHILLRMKRRALVNSTRGARGGYWLLRRPEMISVAEVIAAVDDGRRRAREQPPESASDRAVAELWQELERRQWDFLSQVSVADLLRTVRGE